MFTLKSWGGDGAHPDQMWGRDPNVYIVILKVKGMRYIQIFDTLLFTLTSRRGVGGLRTKCGVNDPNVYITALGGAHPDQMLGPRP